MANVVQGPSLMLTTLDRPSPTMMFLPGLRSLPFWTSYDAADASNDTPSNRVAYQDPAVTRVVEHLQDHAAAITKEYQTVSPTIPSDYDVSTQGGEHAEDSLHTGNWDWHSFLLQGKVQPHFAKHFPVTSKVLTEIGPDLFTETPFGFCFFSKLAGDSTIAAHASPINFRLRIHLPLIVPKGTVTKGDTSTNIGIRVGPIEKQWDENRALVLDDSYDHQVWNKTTEERVVLLVDICHPDVRPSERDEIRRMFQHAQQQGWLKANAGKK
jgi:hypothetical protein